MPTALDFGTRFRTVQSAVTPIPFDSGNVRTMELPRSFLYKTIILRLAGTFTVTGGGSAIAAEAPLNLIRKIELIADGRKTLFSIDGPSAYRMGHLMRGKEPERQFPSGFGVQGPTTISATFILDNMAARMVSSVDSYFDPRPYEKVELRITWGTIADIIVGGTATVNAGTQVDIQIEQTTVGADLGLFNRLLTFDEQTITAVSTAMTINVPRSGLLTGILFRVYNNSAPSDTALNFISLKSDNNFLHADRLDYATLQRRNVVDFQVDGDPPTTVTSGGKMPVGYCYLDLTEDGLITSALNTLDLNVLQLVLDVDAPTGTAFVHPAYVFYEPIPAA